MTYEPDPEIVEASKRRRKRKPAVAPEPLKTPEQAAKELGLEITDEYRALLQRAIDMVQPLCDTKGLLAAVKPTQDVRPFGVSFEDLDAAELPEPPWLVEGLIPSGGVGAISAEPKGAKSWLLYDLALSIASGTPALGGSLAVPEAGGAFIMALEGSGASTRRRFRALAASRSLPDPSWKRRLTIQLVGRMLDLRNGGDLSVLVASALLHEQRMGCKLRLLAIDPLSDAHSGEENKRDSMVTITNALRYIAKQLDITIAFVHHNVKENAANKGRKRGGQKMRGSGALHGVVDFGAYLSDLSGDRKHEFIARLEPETRDGRAADECRLTLRLEDDANRRVVKATFSVAEWTDEEKTGKPGDLPEQRAMGVLHKLFAQEAPLLWEELLKKMKPCGSSELTAAIALCEKEKWIVGHKVNGRAAGYLITELGKEIHRKGRPAPPPPAGV